MKLFLALTLFLVPLSGQQRQIAITFDDLPCAGDCASLQRATDITRGILEALQKEHAPAIGFVNESRLDFPGEREQRAALLKRWIAAGMTLGNHTRSHLDLNQTSVEAYEKDIIEGEATFRALLQARGDSHLYFRFPFTHTGGSAEKKTAIEAFLNARGYAFGPFTVEHEDFLFNAAYDRARDKASMKRIREAYLERLDAILPFVEQVSRNVFGREIPQVLLIHANAINAQCLPEMLKRMKARGYRFISIEQALADPAFATPDLYTGAYGPSWFHRWGIALGKKSPMKGEPETPAWIVQMANASK